MLKWDKRRNVSEIKINNLKIVIVYGHIYYPDCWITSCPPFIDEHILESTTEDDAKKEALNLVRQEIKSINNILEDL